jgi:hypothetical protein
MPFWPQVACHSFAWERWRPVGVLPQKTGRRDASAPKPLVKDAIRQGTKKTHWPKTFLLNAAGFPYNFLQMKKPRPHLENCFLRPSFSHRPFQATVLTTSHL